MKKLPLVNIYNIVRQSHIHPTRFIKDDFDTLKNQIIVAKYYGLPITIALKYDALMNLKYQTLLKDYLDNDDEISTWWEITQELCKKAGVSYNDNSNNVYDDGVSRIYSVGYAIEDRIKLLDAYMQDFYDIFNFYPKTIGSWVIDETTIQHAKEKYGIVGVAICRDQLGTDGFSLWGGYSSGVYFPSKNNIYLPANNRDNQIDLPVFRLLGSDPIYNQEDNLREEMFGVYTFEPASITGRGKFVDWYFDRIINEDSLGINYLHIGQENNFLWPNIKSGYIDQINTLRRLVDEEKVIVQTMKDSSITITNKFKISPPSSYLATEDWSSNYLDVLNYNSNNYRVSFLIEDSHLRIRDMFLFRDEYKSRYLEEKCDTEIAYFDALPILFPQEQIKTLNNRPFIKFYDNNKKEIKGNFEIGSKNSVESYIKLDNIMEIYLSPSSILIEGDISIEFDDAREMKISDNKVMMSYNGFGYNFSILGETIKSDNKLMIYPINSKIEILLSYENPEFIDKYDYSSFSNGDLRKIGENFTEEFDTLKSSDLKYINGPDNDEESKNLLVYPESIKSKSNFDSRSTFSQSLDNLFEYENKGSQDMIDGHWLASTESMIFSLSLIEDMHIDYIEVGCLFNHRQGVIYPKSLKVEVNNKEFSLDLKDYRPESEINKENFRVNINESIKNMNIILENYELMPDWAFYRGTKPVFNMIDKIYIIKK